MLSTLLLGPQDFQTFLRPLIFSKESGYILRVFNFHFEIPRHKAFPLCRFMFKLCKSNNFERFSPIPAEIIVPQILHKFKNIWCQF